MNRTEVIQRILDRKNAPAYLEIGAGDGGNFFRIRARQKVVVDPRFTFSKLNRIRWNIQNLDNVGATYCECTSDGYFSTVSSALRFDVVFIDGLHTYAQSLRDVLNSLKALNENGIILLHDCNPPHPSAAHPAISSQHAAELKPSGWTGEWCGDVWKTICFLRNKRTDLNVFVLDCDYGIGIVTKGKPEAPLDLGKEPDALTYEDLARDRTNFLNLKNERYLFEFLERP